jgi:hypothetical protein
MMNASATEPAELPLRPGSGTYGSAWCRSRTAVVLSPDRCPTRRSQHVFTPAGVAGQDRNAAVGLDVRYSWLCRYLLIVVDSLNRARSWFLVLSEFEQTSNREFEYG